MKHLIYCDESCHLQHDGYDVMVLGALSITEDKAVEASKFIKEIKKYYNKYASYELKWSRVSPGLVAMYDDILDYFLQNNSLSFRALVASGKSNLSHDTYSQSHDDWYYKMYYGLLKTLLVPGQSYKIYLDYKDTQGGKKLRTLHSFLEVSEPASGVPLVDRMQLVRSDEVQLIQLCDILTGIVSYSHRKANTSQAKLHMVNKVLLSLGRKDFCTTSLTEQKFNVFVWTPKGGDCV